MDDVIGFLIGLVIAIAAIIWFVTVALPFLIVYVVLPLAGYGILGKQFHDQLKEYKLTETSWAVLGMIGAMAVLISAVIVSNYGMNGLWIAPMAVMVFLGVSVSVLAIWARVKTKEIRGLGKAFQVDLYRVTREALEHKAEITKLTSVNLEFEKKYDDLIKNKRSLEAHLRELCTMDARIYSIKLKEWKPGIRALSITALAAKKKEYLHGAKNKSTNSAHRIENTIKLALVKLEELERYIGKDWSKYEANKLLLEKVIQRHALLKNKVATLEANINKNKQDYRNMRESRIVLN